jgi:pyruvate,water dikinase
MVPARAAGVFMTLNPANGDRSKVVVESVWGLGEPLVSGLVNPDRFTVDKVTGDVVRREIADKPTEAVQDPVSGRGVVSVDVDEARRRQPSLDRDELAELTRLAKLLERRAGVPQDGEFAVAAGPAPRAVHLVQARPRDGVEPAAGEAGRHPDRHGRHPRHPHRRPDACPAERHRSGARRGSAGEMTAGPRTPD